MKIVITNSHGNNRGDEAAQRGMIYSLQRLFPLARITVLTVSTSGLFLPVEVICYETFSLSKRSFPVLVWWWLHRTIKIRIPSRFKDKNIFLALSEMDDADMIISAPGGPYIGDLYPQHEFREHVLHLFLALFIMRKPVMIYGPSMGPFRSPLRNIIRKFVLERVSIITIRDPISYGYVEAMNLKRPLIRLTADSAFQYTRPISDDELDWFLANLKGTVPGTNRSERPLVGMTIAGKDWNFRQEPYADDKQNGLNTAVARVADYVIKTYDADVILFPQLYGQYSDRELLLDICTRISARNHVYIVPEEYDSDVQQALISRTSVFVGNRYHSVVFALKAHVPVVCLAYEHKATGVMAKAGLQRFVIDTHDIEYDKIVIILDEVWVRRNALREMLKESVARINAEAAVNTLAAAVLIEDTVVNGSGDADYYAKQLSKRLLHFKPD